MRTTSPESDLEYYASQPMISSVIDVFGVVISSLPSNTWIAIVLVL